MKIIRNTLNQKLVLNLKDLDENNKEISKITELFAKDKIEVTEKQFESPHLKTLLEREIIEDITEEGSDTGKKTDTGKKPGPAKKKTAEEILGLPSEEIKKELLKKEYSLDDTLDVAKKANVEHPKNSKDRLIPQIIEAIEAQKNTAEE